MCYNKLNAIKQKNITLATKNNKFLFNYLYDRGEYPRV